MSVLPVVAIGGSLGAATALASLLPQLDELEVAVAAVLHLPAGSDDVFAGGLRCYSRRAVVVAESSTLLDAESLVLAPAEHHLLVDGLTCTLSLEAPVHHARPSIDVLFESVEMWARGPIAGVLLSGATEDGATGLARIEERGGLVLVQSPDEAEAPRMPRAGIASCRRPFVGPARELGAQLRHAFSRVP